MGRNTVCSPFPELPGHPFSFVPGPWLTLVDGVLWQLAELAVDDPCIGAQEFLLAGSQLQGESAEMREERGPPLKAPHLLPLHLPSCSLPSMPGICPSSHILLPSWSPTFTRLPLTLDLDQCLLWGGVDVKAQSPATHQWPPAVSGLSISFSKDAVCLPYCSLQWSPCPAAPYLPQERSLSEVTEDQKGGVKSSPSLPKIKMEWKDNLSNAP